MIALLTVISLIAIIYPIYSIYKTKSIPESLSDTYYTLEDKGYLFQIAISVVAIMLLPIWLSVSYEYHQFLAFIGCSSLLFVAAAPSFKLKLDGIVHYISASLCCTSSILWQLIEGLYDVTLFFLLLGFMLYLRYSKWCFWLELAIIYSIIINIWRLIL
jgi:hypothetical protein